MRVCDRCATVKETKHYTLEEECVEVATSKQVSTSQLFKWHYDLCTSCEKDMRLYLQHFLVNDLAGKVISHD